MQWSVRSLFCTPLGTFALKQRVQVVSCGQIMSLILGGLSDSEGCEVMEMLALFFPVASVFFDKAAKLVFLL